MNSVVESMDFGVESGVESVDLGVDSMESGVDSAESGTESIGFGVDSMDSGVDFVDSGNESTGFGDDSVYSDMERVGSDSVDSGMERACSDSVLRIRFHSVSIDFGFSLSNVIEGHKIEAWNPCSNGDLNFSSESRRKDSKFCFFCSDTRSNEKYSKIVLGILVVCVFLKEERLRVENEG